MIYMTNKIVAIQGDNLKKINIKTDTTIFLANEAQNKGYKLFYYYPENLSNIRGKTVSEGYFIKIDYYTGIANKHQATCPWSLTVIAKKRLGHVNL